MILLIEEDDNHKYYSVMEDINEMSVLEDFLNNPNGRQEWELIPFSQYKAALIEFVKYGKFMRFPTDTIYKWMGKIMRNTAQLRANTTIAGHDNLYDPYEMYDILSRYLPLLDEYVSIDDFKSDDYEIEDSIKEKILEIEDSGKLEYTDCDIILDRLGMYEWMLLPDDSMGFSDYGISPIEKIISEYNSNSTPEETIVLINKILDVTHMRGDLSSIFIEGGQKALANISYNENKKHKKIIFSEQILKKIIEKRIFIE